jgi:hypothetical protein
MQGYTMIDIKCPYCGSSTIVEIPSTNRETVRTTTCKVFSCLKYFTFRAIRSYEVESFPIEGINQK